jgi:hypothetical protein
MKYALRSFKIFGHYFPASRIVLHVVFCETRKKKPGRLTKEGWIFVKKGLIGKIASFRLHSPKMFTFVPSES